VIRVIGPTGAHVVAASVLSVLMWASLKSSDMGVKFLTPETYSEAIACGRSGVGCAVAPYQLCPAELAQYSAWIATPFSRVASSVFERMNRRQRPRPMERGAANAWGLGIYVAPSESHEKAESILRVAIRRRGRVIVPTTITLAPIRVGADSETKQLVRGFLAFPMDTLSPGADVAVILTGTSGEVTCTITPGGLQRIR
jgi:hypothetical protein